MAFKEAQAYEKAQLEGFDKYNVSEYLLRRQERQEHRDKALKRLI